MIYGSTIYGNLVYMVGLIVAEKIEFEGAIVQISEPKCLITI